MILREAKRKIRLVEDENKVFRRADTSLSQANLAGHCCTYSPANSPSTGFRWRWRCWVVKLVPQPFHRWCAYPVTGAQPMGQSPP